MASTLKWILIILTVVVITVIVVIVSAALRFFLTFRIFLNHLDHPRLLHVDANPFVYMALSIITSPQSFSSTQSVSPEIPCSVITDLLPLFVVMRRSSTSTVDCAVCLSKFHNNDLLRLLPPCHHAFHAECIDTWLRSKLSCPLCRSPILASDSDLANVLRSPSGDSFHIGNGSVSNRVTTPDVAPLVLCCVEGPLSLKKSLLQKSRQLRQMQQVLEETGCLPELEKTG